MLYGVNNTENISKKLFGFFDVIMFYKDNKFGSTTMNASINTMLKPHKESTHSLLP